MDRQKRPYLQIEVVETEPIHFHEELELLFLLEGRVSIEAGCDKWQIHIAGGDKTISTSSLRSFAQNRPCAPTVNIFIYLKLSSRFPASNTASISMSLNPFTHVRELNEPLITISALNSSLNSLDASSKSPHVTAGIAEEL